MKKVVVFLALLVWLSAPAGASPLHGGGGSIQDALQTLISNICPAQGNHNCWKKLNASTFLSVEPGNSLANYDGGYVSTTGSWGASANTITVTSNTGIVVGDAVQGTGIPSPDWVTQINGNTLTLFSVTTGASGGTIPVSFSAAWFNDGGASVVGGTWAFSRARYKIAPPKITFNGGGDNDSGDSGTYQFDPVACAASLNASQTTNCNWVLKVKPTRYLPLYNNGGFNIPSWSCQGINGGMQDFFVTTAASLSSSSTSVTLTGTPTNAMTAGADVWDAAGKIAPGTTVVSQSGTSLVLSQNPASSSAGNITLYYNSNTSSDSVFARALTTTAGSTSATINSNARLVSGTKLSGPAIGAGTTMTFSGTAVTLSQPAIFSQTNGQVFIAAQLLAGGNPDGLHVQQAVHSYFDDWAVPGGTKWLMGQGGFGWSQGSGGGSGGGGGSLHVFDDTKALGDSTGWQDFNGGPLASCDPHLLTLPGSVGPAYSAADGILYGMDAFSHLNAFTTPFTSPSQSTIATVSTSFGQPGFTDQQIIPDPVNGAGHYALFVDGTCPTRCGASAVNAFAVWTDITCRGSCPNQTFTQGAYNTSTGVWTNSTGANTRAFCPGPDGNIYASEGQGVITKITPNSNIATGWSLTALNTAPATSPNESDSSAQNMTLMCLGTAYSSAFILVAGGLSNTLGNVWLYVR